MRGGNDRTGRGEHVLDTRPAPRDLRGAHRTVQPTGEERTFGADELIVSKTDPRGVITYANDVFLRVSAYEYGDVIGQPHNLIRHPAMPKAVFQLLWDTLADRREILAHVTPSYARDGSVTGYHSNRRRPSPGAIAQVTPLYDRLLAEEKRHPNGRAAVEASSRLLGELVAEQADSYETFIWSIIGREEH
jgi:PAS domain-containing protein